MSRQAPSPAARPPDVGTRIATFRAVAGAILVATIVGCGLSLTTALVSVRLQMAGASGRAIGLVAAAGGLASLASAPLIPRVARRIGIVPMLLGSILAGAAILVGFSLTERYPAWVALQFAMGLSATIEFVLSEYWITASVPESRRGFAIGLYVTSLSLGFAAGPLILVATGAAGNLPFHVGAALFFVAAIPLALIARSVPSLTERPRRGALGVLWQQPAAAAAALLHGAIEIGGLGLLPVYALSGGLDAAQGARFASLFVVGNSLFQLPIGWVADRIDRARLLAGLAGLGLVGAALLATIGPSPTMVFAVLLLVWGGLVGAFYPVGLGLLGARRTGADLAGANAAFVMTYAAGTLIGPPILGLGLDLLRPAGFFWAMALLIALYLAVAVPSLLRRRGASTGPGL